MSTITKVSIITPNFGTAHVPLSSAAADVAKLPGSYVYRAWEVDPLTRKYVFDTGANDYEPLCIFPLPAETSAR